MRIKIILAAFGFLIGSGPVLADDLTGSGSFLCAASTAAKCTHDGECLVDEPWIFNIPDFVIVDLKAKVIGTTEASSETREAAIQNMERTDGLIVLQGMQNRRAWSWVIDELTGEGVMSFADEERAVAIFGACTPLEKLK